MRSISLYLCHFKTFTQRKLTALTHIYTWDLHGATTSAISHRATLRRLWVHCFSQRIINDDCQSREECSLFTTVPFSLLSAHQGTLTFLCWQVQLLLLLRHFMAQPSNFELTACALILYNVIVFTSQAHISLKLLSPHLISFSLVRVTEDINRFMLSA